VPFAVRVAEPVGLLALRAFDDLLVHQRVSDGGFAVEIFVRETGLCARRIALWSVTRRIRAPYSSHAEIASDNPCYRHLSYQRAILPKKSPVRFSLFMQALTVPFEVRLWYVLLAIGSRKSAWSVPGSFSSRSLTEASLTPLKENNK
jgi:hypothetical protein